MMRMKIIGFMILICVPNWLSAQNQYQTAIAKARFLIRMHQSATQIPGIQVAVWIDGDWIWQENFGLEDIEK